MRRRALRSASMQDRILKLLRRRDYVPADARQLRADLDLASRHARRLKRELEELERRGEIARIKGDRYVLPREADLVPGRIQIMRQGRGFLLPDEAGLGEIAIRSTDTGTALHDDRVLVRRNVRPLGRRAQEEHTETGVVVRVLERRRTQLVGTLKRGREFLRVVPDDPRMHHDVLVPPARDVGREPRDGDKVVVELGTWKSPNASPTGTITEVLGPPTAEGVDMLSVLRQYDLALKFPRKVLAEVRRFDTEVTRRDLKGRRDCRDAPVITIDPADAKDFDDAFSLERTRSKRWKLCVHIADVSHYVKPGSALDEEARKRGNSTYLVDRVVPMLPEALSNELCSLKPNVERLSKCVEFLLADDGGVLRSRCYPAVIRSRRRYSYEQAMEVLSSSKGDELDRMLEDAGRLAQKIRKSRFRAGSLELDFPESKIRLDDRGRIERIDRVENDESHQLVEEFMLLTNEAVATRLMRQRRPALYRVHEPPSPDRLDGYRQEVLGHDIPCGDLEKPGEVKKLLRRLRDSPLGPALRIGLLKSLMRARYAVEALGHYGLAKSKYTHFTSPIRRYADLIVHRVLFDELDENPGVMKETADHISATERNSADAERDSKSVKLQAYLLDQLRSGRPQRYSALVTDVRNFGFFVDVSELGMSGLVPLSSLEDDFYEFDPAKILVRGRRTRRVIRLGDSVDVEIAKVDSIKKRMDFRLVEQAKPAKAKRSAKTRTGSERRGRSSTELRRRSKAGRKDDRPAKAESSRKDRSARSAGGGAGTKSKARKRDEQPTKAATTRKKRTTRSEGDGENSKPKKRRKSKQPTKSNPKRKKRMDRARLKKERAAAKPKADEKPERRRKAKPSTKKRTKSSGSDRPTAKGGKGAKRSKGGKGPAADSSPVRKRKASRRKGKDSAKRKAERTADKPSPRKKRRQGHGA